MYIQGIQQFFQLTDQQQTEILNGLKTKERLYEYLERQRPKKEIIPHWATCNKCNGSGQVFIEPRDNNGVHASQIHLCKRKLWFDVKGYGNNHQSENAAKLQMIFDHGTALHEMLQHYGSKGAWGPYYEPEVKLLPTVEQCQAKNVPVYPLAIKYQIKSSVDAAVRKVQIDNVTGIGTVFIDVVHEYKSIGSNGYGSLETAKPVHKMQAIIYQACLNIPITVFIYYNKDKDDLKCIPVKFDGYVWAQVEDKIIEVLAQIDEEDATLAIPDHLSAGILNPSECTGGAYSSACMYYKKICFPPIVEPEPKLIPAITLVKKKVGRPKKITTESLAPLPVSADWLDESTRS